MGEKADPAAEDGRPDADGSANDFANQSGKPDRKYGDFNFR